MFFAVGMFQRWREKYWPKPAICVGVSLQGGHVLCCWVVPTLAGEVLSEASYMCWCVIAGWTCSLLLACSNVGVISTGRSQLYVLVCHCRLDMFFAVGMFQRWRDKYWPKSAICVGVPLQVGHVLCCWHVPTLAGEVLAEASYMCWCAIAGGTCSLL